MHSRMARIVATLAVVMVVSMSGCGGKDNNGSSGVDDSTLEIRRGALGAKIRGLDPGDIGDVTSSSMASYCYETLYQYHYLKRPYEIIPCLAAEMPTISDDGLVLTIPLRQDVYFFDDECFPGGKGRQVVAGDFIYAWKRVANIKYRSKNWWIFDGRIKGLDEFREYTESAETVDFDRPVEGLEAVDDFTLRIRLTEPWPQALYMLAHLPTAPMAREAVDHYGEQIINHAVGTGPYVLHEWRRGQRISFRKNPNFREELYPSQGEPEDEARGLLTDAGRPLPLNDGADFQVIEEDQPRWLLFMQGKLDASGIPKDMYAQAITDDRTLTPELKEKGIKLIIQEDPSTFWYGFNMEDPVVGENLPLRRAISVGFNRAEYIDVFTNNRGKPAKGIIPPMYEAFDESWQNPYTQYDTGRARKLLAEARQVAGNDDLEVTLSLPGTDTQMRQMGQYFQRSMEAIGLKADVDYMDWPTFQDKVKTKSVQMFAMGWVGDIPDAENFLQLFYGPNESPGPNNFNYKNEHYDELFGKIRVMQPGPERLKLYRQMEKIVMEDCPVVVLLHGVGFVPYYDWVHNYKPHAFGYGLGKYQRIDVALRSQRRGD